MSPEHDLRCISKFLFTLGLLFKVTFYSKGNLPIVFFLSTIAETTVSSVLPTVVLKKG